MEKIKRLSPWDIFDLWETDAGKMNFAGTWDRSKLRFTVRFHDDGSGFDHTSSAEIDGAFFMQMPRAEYKEWAKKAVHDPRYSVSGLKEIDEVRARLDMYQHPIRYVMYFLYYDMDASIGSRNAAKITGIDPHLTFSDIVAKYLDDEDGAEYLWGWVPDALVCHYKVPIVKMVEHNFWNELEDFREDENLEDHLRHTAKVFAPRAGAAMRRYIVSTLTEEEMETLCKTLRKIGSTWDSTLAEITVQYVHFHAPEQIRKAWYDAQKDNDIFPGAGATPGMFEVISHG